MKAGKSLQELAFEIERQREVKQDYVAATGGLHMDGEGGLLLPVPALDRLPVNDLAHRQIAERLAIPAKYYERLRVEFPSLLAENVNTLFHAKSERRLIRVLDGRVRAFLSDRYQRIDNYDVANTVLPVLAEIPGIRTVSTEVTESRLYIKAVTAEISTRIESRRVGDVVQAGVLISNSEVGLGAVTVKPFALQLVCLNGMIRDKGVLRAAHLGRRLEGEEVAALLTDEALRAEDNAVLLRVRDVVRAAFDLERFRAWMEQVQGSVEQPIRGDVPQVVEQAGEVLGLSGPERSNVLRHLILGGDLSRYGLMNAITRTAEDVPSYDRATELEAIGPALIDLPRKEWERIAEAA
jgi:hypothetical protein